MNKTTVYDLCITDIERRLIVKALVDLKEEQIREKKEYSFIDDLIVKVCDVTPRKKKFYERG